MPKSPKPTNNILAYAVIFSGLIVSASLVFVGVQFSGNDTLKASITGPTDEVKQPEVKKIVQNAPAAAKPTEDPAKNVKKVTKTDHIRGNANAKISVIEYSDFQCPFCQRVHPTLKSVLEKYGDKVNWVYRHYPLPFHNPEATSKAEAAECANELGGNDKFWEMTDYFYENMGSKVDELPAIAKKIGLNESAFKTCLESGKYKDHINKDMSEGSAAGVTGTPGNIVLNNKTGEAIALKGAKPLSSFETVIDEMLK